MVVFGLAYGRQTLLCNPAVRHRVQGAVGMEWKHTALSPTGVGFLLSSIFLLRPLCGKAMEGESLTLSTQSETKGNDL